MSNTKNDSLLHSYFTLRKAVGWIGMLLPFVLAIGMVMIFGVAQLQPSISHYYHTQMRDLFVGAVCAIALFLFFYRGYDNWGRINWDNVLTSFAGFCAVGLALFPTTATGPSDISGTIHLLCATAFFITLAFYSIFVFTKSGKPKPTDHKEVRNLIYRLCGILMLVSLAGIAIKMLFFSGMDSAFVFWGETVALIAFGVSWLTKGGAIFADRKSG